MVWLMDMVMMMTNLDVAPQEEFNPPSNGGVNTGPCRHNHR